MGKRKRNSNYYYSISEHLFEQKDNIVKYCNTLIPGIVITINLVQQTLSLTHNEWYVNITSNNFCLTIDDYEEYNYPKHNFERNNYSFKFDSVSESYSIKYRDYLLLKHCYSTNDTLIANKYHFPIVVY